MRALPVAGAAAGHPTVSRRRRRGAAGVLRRLAAPARLRLHRRCSDRLSERELRAVLAHEQHHGALRDPLRLAVGRVLCQALFFLPVLRPLHERYADVAELRADAAALEATDGATAPLASAMLALGATPSGGVVGISPERVDSLLGRPPAWRLPRMLLIAALVTIAALVALVWRASGRRVRPGEPQPPDRLLAALRARAGPRAGAGLPGGRGRPRPRSRARRRPRR